VQHLLTPTAISHLRKEDRNLNDDEAAVTRVALEVVAVAAMIATTAGAAVAVGGGGLGEGDSGGFGGMGMESMVLQQWRRRLWRR
jgi:hypothetical protein